MSQAVSEYGGPMVRPAGESNVRATEAHTTHTYSLRHKK